MTGKSRKSRKIAEFGDFQTPGPLAVEVCRLLAKEMVHPASVLEPTCGRGSFLKAALDRFPAAEQFLGLDINPDHVRAARTVLGGITLPTRVRIREGDFFTTDWPSLLNDLPDPILVVGNPPWVTAAELGMLKSTNLPEKSNFQHHKGLDALTGKSNFDVSEWMLIRILNLISHREAAMAMLCKTAVARKVLTHCWQQGIHLQSARIHLIDARQHFGAAVEACLLFCTTGRSRHTRDCRVFPSLEDRTGRKTFGFRDGILVANVEYYRRWKHLQGPERLKWRSGIKHDCARVMILRQDGNLLLNGLGESVDLEPANLYPLFKGSDLMKDPLPPPTRWMLITQQFIGEETDRLRKTAPKTWRYLLRHADRLDRRSSSIYRNRPRFSLFGVGAYSFAPWKVAISGFYTSLKFRVLGRTGGKPAVLDDTSYFLPCHSRREARHLAARLNSPPAQEFYKAFIFPDAKRPVTREILSRLDLSALSRPDPVSYIEHRNPPDFSNERSVP